MFLISFLLLGEGGQGSPALLLGKPEGPLSTPRLCPKYRWEYPFRIQVHELLGAGISELRFEIFCQSARRLVDAESVARALGKLYELLKGRLRTEHPRSYHQRVVVYLAEGGSAGGEQGIFQGQDEGGNLILQNAVYIYHLESFTNSLEKLREVAHEYGHAVLPPVGGFEKPESWANGFLGETLFLYWALQELREGRWKPEEVFGVELSAITVWVSKNVTPLADAVWLRGVDATTLSGKGEQALKEYLGLVLYIAEAFPEALPRALKLGGGTLALDILNGFFLALEERPDWRVLVPERHQRTPLWLPLPQRGQWLGGGILRRSGKWVQIQPRSAQLTLRVPETFSQKEASPADCGACAIRSRRG